MLISKEAIEAVKRRHELAAFVAGSAGVELRPEGAHLVGRCPFHDDTKASLVVNPKKQLWNCLGACSARPKEGGGRGGSGGDLLAFAMKLWGVGFREAFERLGGDVSQAPARPRRAPPPAAAGQEVRRGPGREPLAPAGRAPRTEIFGRVLEHYHRELAASREAQEYLESRGLRTRALWRRFKVGYASGSLPELAGEEGPARELLVSLGLLTRQGRERMAGRVVFPFSAFNRLPVSLYGRSIDGSREPHHLYLPGPRRGLFNWEAARHAGELLLVESVLDALSLIEAGITAVVPLYGAHGVIDEHRELVKRFGIRRVVVALDADAAGREAAPVAAAAFAAPGVVVETLEWPAKDANDLLVQEGPAKLKETTEALLGRPRAVPVALSAPPGEAGPGSSSPIASPPDAEAIGEKGPGAKPSREALVAEALVLAWEGRLWRIVWAPKPAVGRMRATVRVELAWGEAATAGEGPAPPPAAYLDALDLYAARAREGFAKRAVRSFAAGAERAGRTIAEEATAALAARLEADLLAIVELGEERCEALARREAGAVVPSPAERAEALALLRSRELLARVARDLSAVGYVGEEDNKTLGYLVSVSRKLPHPLSMVILSPSGSGKSGLAEAVEALTPPEELFSLSSLTPQALYYLPPDKLRRKLLLIEERAGSEAADFSIRALQSKHRLTRAVPIKDPSSGKIETRVFEIRGPSAFIETTTESRIHLENATRCFEIHLDESEEQTRRIQEAQRRAKTFAGLAVREERERAVALHHAAQRLLRRVAVVIPYAERLEFPSAWLRTRRDHLRFLHLVEAVAFLHQHQRPVVDRETREPVGCPLADLSEEELDRAVVLATLEDYRAAYHLARGLLGESLLDLKRPERAFLARVRSWVAERSAGPEASAVAFSRRELREETGLPQHRVRQLFEVLIELEYVEPVGASRGAGVRYRLTGAARPQESVPGLLTPEELAGRLEQGESGEREVQEGRGADVAASGRR